MALVPGLVDSHSHIGQVEGADSTGPIQPEARVLEPITCEASGNRIGGLYYDAGGAYGVAIMEAGAYYFRLTTRPLDQAP